MSRNILGVCTIEFALALGVFGSVLALMWAFIVPREWYEYVVPVILSLIIAVVLYKWMQRPRRGD